MHLRVGWNAHQTNMAETRKDTQAVSLCNTKLSYRVKRRWCQIERERLWVAVLVAMCAECGVVWSCVRRHDSTTWCNSHSVSR
jgi:hypothetical protein